MDLTLQQQQQQQAALLSLCSTALLQAAHRQVYVHLELHLEAAAATLHRLPFAAAVGAQHQQQ